MLGEVRRLETETLRLTRQFQVLSPKGFLLAQGDLQCIGQQFLFGLGLAPSQFGLTSRFFTECVTATEFVLRLGKENAPLGALPQEFRHSLDGSLPGLPHFRLGGELQRRGGRLQACQGAIHLDWSDNAFTGDPQRFQWYRVYSASYDLDLGLCGADWSLEGTTVAPEFLAGALANGLPRCYGVSAISREGYESLWSPLRQDTPRPDSRNVLAFAFDENTSQAGFRFWDDVNQDGLAQPTELGLVQDGSRTDIDFWVYRDPADSTLWLVPEVSGTSLRLYASSPISDLTDIDFAPAGGYSRNMIQAAPGFGYVFEIVEGSTLRYGALRVTHVGRDYLIFDWSLQTDPGNPELVIRGNLPTSLETGMVIPGAK